MDGLGFPVLHGQVEGYLSKFKRRPIRRGKCEVPTRLRFYSTENIGRPAALVFVVPSGFPARCSRRGGSNVGMQRYRRFIQAHHPVLRMGGLFIRLPNILPLGGVVFLELGHVTQFVTSTT